MDSPDRCIYCLRPDGPFTKEHVIPDAFGLFGSQTMVLHNDEVCHACNQGFGRDLDQVLSRDSYEGLLRADIFPRTSKRRDYFKPRRTLMKFPDEPRFGDLRGLRVEIDWSVRRPRLAAQAVVKGEDGHSRKTFTLEELSTADPALFRKRPKAVQVFAPDLESFVPIQAKLRAMGVRFPSRPNYIELPPALRGPSVTFEIDGTIDTRVLRAIGKIAFNYLAFTEGPQRVRSDTFSEMRLFVRGEGPAPAGHVSLDPIFLDAKRARPTHSMHIILIERRQQEIWASVSLFNTFSYHFRMSRDTIIWYALRTVHTFDAVKKSVHKVTPVPKALWVPRIYTP